MHVIKNVAHLTLLSREAIEVTLIKHQATSLTVPVAKELDQAGQACWLQQSQRHQPIFGDHQFQLTTVKQPCEIQSINTLLNYVFLIFILKLIWLKRKKN
jgi:hypothetical protein